MFLSLRMHARHWSNPLGRYFFQDQPKTTDRASDPDAPNQGSTNWRHRCDGHCGARPRCRRAAAGPGQTTSQRTEQHQRPGTTGVEGAGGTGGHGRGAGGRRQGQGGPRDRPLRAAGSRVAISRAGRRPPARTAARPFKADPPAPETPAAPHATPPERIPYSPRNALIAGISRTACTRPAR